MTLFPCVPVCASVPMCSLCASVPMCSPLCLCSMSSSLNADLILIFARQEYFTSERVGHVQLCVMVSSGHVERPTQVYISTEDMSATGRRGEEDQ